MNQQCSRFCCCAVFHDADTRSLNGTSEIVPSVQSTFMSRWICAVSGLRAHDPVGAESRQHIVRAGDVTPAMVCGPDGHDDGDESFWPSLWRRQDAQEGCKKDFWGNWTLRALVHRETSEEEEGWEASRSRGRFISQVTELLITNSIITRVTKLMSHTPQQPFLKIYCLNPSSATCQSFFLHNKIKSFLNKPIGTFLLWIIKLLIYIKGNHGYQGSALWSLSDIKLGRHES